MVMTHYMELLASNAPWNLILFMVIPMGVGELLVATEFFNLFYGGANSSWKSWNRNLGIFLGVYYLLAVAYIVAQVIPSIDEWRTWIDFTAVYAYVLAVIPIFMVTLMEFNVFGKEKTDREKTKLHATLLVVYLIIGHLAMIFGMTSPALAGYMPANRQMQMTESHDMGGHSMDGRMDSHQMQMK